MPQPLTVVSERLSFRGNAVLLQVQYVFQLHTCCTQVVKQFLWHMQDFLYRSGRRCVRKNTFKESKKMKCVTVILQIEQWKWDLGNRSVMSAALISLCLLSYSQRVLLPSLSLSVWQAQLQRGNILLKQGKLDEAESDFKKVVSTVHCCWNFASLLWWTPIFTRRCQCWSAVLGFYSG